jgi:membrane associated rhomboid family serine protease
MIAGRHSEDYSPLTWVGRVPIYATTLLVIAHVCSMIGVTIALSAADPTNPAAPTWLTPFTYSSVSVLHEYKVWQFVTYAFVNAPGITFAIDMFLLYMFGREVERFLGRSAFLKLYVALLLVPPTILTLLAYFNFPAALFPATMGGSFEVHFAIFIAFVVIYPNAEVFFLRIQMKWLAAILLAIYSLQDIAYHATMGWIPLFVLWLECACAVLMLKLAGVTNASIEAWLPQRDEYESEPKPRRKLPAPKPEPNLHDSIDPLLEKISKQGIGSLTKRERQQLEQARDALLEQEKHSHR